MSFLSTVLKGVSNPFIRQIATGVAGAIKGQAGADLVNKGFTLFDQIKSAFDQFAHPNATNAGTTTAPSSLKDPRTALIASGSSALTSVGSSQAADTSSPSGGVSAATIVGNSGSTGSGYGLTPDQENLFKEAGVDPNSKEGKQMKLQMMMANYTNAIQMLSNLSKMISDMQKGIIQNIRS